MPSEGEGPVKEQDCDEATSSIRAASASEPKMTATEGVQTHAGRGRR